MPSIGSAPRTVCIILTSIPLIRGRRNLSMRPGHFLTSGSLDASFTLTFVIGAESQSFECVSLILANKFLPGQAVLAVSLWPITFRSLSSQPSEMPHSIKRLDAAKAFSVGCCESLGIH